MFSTRLFILAIFCVNSAICQKKLCDLSDEKCVTSSARRIFPKWVAGIPGVKPSEPLHVEKIEANLPKMKYSINHGTLAGMKDCKVDNVKIDAKNPKYDLYLTCPLLKLEASFEMKGELGPHFVEGSGKGIADYYGSYVHLFGDYEAKDKDGKLHIHFKNFNLDLDPKEKVVFNLKDVFKGDKKKADEVHQFLNENWKLVSQGLAGPAMQAFMKEFVDNVNDYMAMVPVEDIFIQE